MFETHGVGQIPSSFERYLVFIDLRVILSYLRIEQNIFADFLTVNEVVSIWVKVGA